MGQATATLLLHHVVEPEVESVLEPPLRRHVFEGSSVALTTHPPSLRCSEVPLLDLFRSEKKTGGGNGGDENMKVVTFYVKQATVLVNPVLTEVECT